MVYFRISFKVFCKFNNDHKCANSDHYYNFEQEYPFNSVQVFYLEKYTKTKTCQKLTIEMKLVS